MNKAFFKEDARKDRLFASWNKYLSGLHFNPQDRHLDEVYEGIATVNSLAGASLRLNLVDIKKQVHIEVAPEISGLTKKDDCIYLILGRQKGKWMPLDVVSIASIIRGKQTGAHLSYNPIMMHAQNKGVMARGSEAVH